MYVKYTYIHYITLHYIVYVCTDSVLKLFDEKKIVILLQVRRPGQFLYACIPSVIIVYIRYIIEIISS